MCPLNVCDGRPKNALSSSTGITTLEGIRKCAYTHGKRTSRGERRRKLSLTAEEKETQAQLSAGGPTGFGDGRDIEISKTEARAKQGEWWTFDSLQLLISSWTSSGESKRARQ
jgi:hypothetical protein